MAAPNKNNQAKKVVSNKSKVVSKGNEKVPATYDLRLTTQNELLLLAGISIITFICFHYSLLNQFVSWDDGIYINDDKYITSFTASHIFSILFQDITLNYYHPFTMLTYAIDYHLFGMKPMGYYLTAILIHIANVIVIYYFTKTLINSMVGAGYKPLKAVPWLVAILALWHGIHPMHVESVSWISERKDIMYSFFYFLGLILYMKYLKGEKMKWMLYINILFTLLSIWGLIGLSGFSINMSKTTQIPVAVIFGFLILLCGGAAFVEFKYKNIRLEIFYVFEIFLLSLFSKPMAVSFPLSLLAIDILMKRDIIFNPHKGTLTNWFVIGFKLCMEKWMFFLTAVLSGIQSVLLEVGHNTVVLTHGYNLFQKLLISSYAFNFYMAKIFLPLNLCSYYPYPGLNHDLSIEYPIYYYSPFISMLIIGVPLFLAWSMRKKHKDNFRIILFGILFFFSNVVFILQFVSAGTTVVSDRYSYVAYFGIFFIFIYFAHVYWYKNKSLRTPILLAGSVISVILGYLCFERTRVWHDNKSLWTDVINKTNERSELPYYNLGNWYIINKQMPDSAYPYFTTLVRLHTKNADVFRSLGKIYGMRQKFDSSLYFQNKSIAIEDTIASAYMDRGVTYCMMGKLDLGLKDFNKSYSMDSTDPGLWAYRATALMQSGQYQLAMFDLNKLVIKHPENGDFFFQRGSCELNLNKIDEAIKDYQQALTLKPKYPDCLYQLSMAYDRKNDKQNALDYALKAKAAGGQVPDDYINKLHP